MRSVIYGVLLTVLVGRAGIVQAANNLDGKALVCVGYHKYKYTHPMYGLVFEDGKVSRHVVNGYSKVIEYSVRYKLLGTNKVAWVDRTEQHSLDRETLQQGTSRCTLSSKNGVNRKLDEIIANAKKKNML